MLSHVGLHVVACCVVCDRAQSCCGFAQGADVIDSMPESKIPMLVAHLESDPCCCNALT